MIRFSLALLLLLGLGTSAFRADVGDGTTAWAPAKGFVYVQTSYPSGERAPYVPISIQKLSGNYPIPPGRYVTDAFGKIWIALYPGVYRFRAQGAAPAYIDVSVTSNSESYIFFVLPYSPKRLDEPGSALPVGSAAADRPAD